MVRLTRRTASRQLGGVEWRWPSGRLSVFASLERKGKWCAVEDTESRRYPYTYHPDPESAARSLGATTEEAEA